MGKFEIPNIPPTTNKCIRFPNDLIEQVESIIENKNCSFSAFVIAATKETVNGLKRVNK